MNIIRTSLLLLTTAFFSDLHADVNAHFNQIKRSPNALYAFFKAMPKGGELHYHLTGASYPETILQIASTEDYCLQIDSLAINRDMSRCNGIKTKNILDQPKLYSQIIQDWSFKDFIPGVESGHDHFFNSFAKFNPIVSDHKPELLANIIQRAADQNELYLEIMDIPDDAHSIGFGKLLHTSSSFKEKRDLLLANKAFQNNISETATKAEIAITKAREHLGCEANPDAKPCKIKIKFLYFSLREQPLNELFAQTLNGFEAIIRSKGTIVGVNLVQAEDGIISLRDYRQQMRLFQYFHALYPQIPIALHAGELKPEAVVPEDLRFHIHDAVFTGHAQRIGHGVDIAYENDAEKTIAYMAKNQLAVEVNLISNWKILNVKGSMHPLNYYLAHKVPVVLSTDDEGILRTDLTSQYVQAAAEHNLEYQKLKQITRNALTYAFLPGKSIWTNPGEAERVVDCKDLNSEQCKTFIRNNEKANIQWDLEQKLVQFESTFN